MTTIHDSNPRSVDDTFELTAIRHDLLDENESQRPAPPPQPSRLWTRLGWLFAVLAVAGAVTLAVVALHEPANVERPITDAKDHPGYGPNPLVPVERGVTDAKDHPGYGPNPLVPVVEPAG